MAAIIYSPKDIFEQEFKVTMRGFDKAEVDEFLDNVINDYELFLAEIDSLKKENARLKAKLKEVMDQQEANTAPYTPPLVTPDYPMYSEPETFTPTSASNFDILKRISRLEREVFGKQIQE
ncbi:cell division regulator GpsB [Streptococcus entericus]|uniref:cell division regulator GpsB n=1 Tax=Streptococcus entericus TaxID=155680 RepID=UPI00037717A9|nr:cell division regulator GpsB [Streptococcus entericus]